MSTDTRWKQRFQNFEKAYNVFIRISSIKNPSEAERMGLIQAFEMVFELAWKVMQDYLKAQGYLIKGPKEVIKQAYQDNLIQDGHVWMEAFNSRNETVHMYEEHKAEELINLIYESYLINIQDLYHFLQTRLITERIMA